MGAVEQAMTDQVVHFSDISKRKLARTVNEQSTQIRELRQQVKHLAKILIAIAQEPDAFQVVDDCVRIAQTALAQVAYGSQLKLEITAEAVLLRAVPPTEAPTLLAPRIVGVSTT